MGREIRMVPKDWRHPIDPNTERPRPMHDGADFHERAQDWLDGCARWVAGERPEYADADAPKYYWDYEGNPPSSKDYMLIDVPKEQRTHFMLYETTTEGTPCRGCPAFATLDELCEWAASHATTFAAYTATREEWRKMLDGGLVSATDPSMPGVMFI